jgi:HJR/Mrr/RecB family endonuclease
MSEYFVALILFVISTFLAPLLVDEFADWMPWLSRQLVTRAARRLPISSRDRYEEEWLAEQTALPGGKLNQVRFGISIFVRSFQLRRALNEVSHKALRPLQWEQLSHNEFEYLVRNLISAMGYRKYATAPTMDGGVDIIARKRRLFMNSLVVVEIKRCQGPVPVNYVRAFLWAAKEHRAKRAIFITTSRFGPASQKLAKRYKQLELIDGAALNELLAEHMSFDLQDPTPT